MTFAERLSYLMQRDGITKYRLSKLAGCSATTVANWLSGKEVTPTYLQRLSVLFEVSTDYLLGGSENENTPTLEGERELGFDDFDYALYNESKNLPEEKKQMLLSMARFMRQEADKEK